MRLRGDGGEHTIRMGRTSRCFSLMKKDDWNGQLSRQESGDTKWTGGLQGRGVCGVPAGPDLVF